MPSPLSTFIAGPRRKSRHRRGHRRDRSMAVRTDGRKFIPIAKRIGEFTPVAKRIGG